MKLRRIKRYIALFLCIFVLQTIQAYEDWYDDATDGGTLDEVCVTADPDDYRDNDDDWVWRFDEDEKIDDDVHMDDWISGGELDEVGVTAPKPGNNNNEKPNIQVIAPNAKEIFKNDKMSENSWNILEKMIEKIINDCIGEALYEGLKLKLNGKVFTIVFDIKPPGGGETNLNNSSIILRELESNILFHEMVHAYQAYGETQETYYNALLNLEIEAWYAQY
ncbi:MAG: hypothetical protein LUG18_15165, partial [Candidatus Azobacteroides sp.]|nr:hypothetical protein [Candidatus Azobacteroides sp.]